MNPKGIEAVAEWLSRLGIPFVVVGGTAVERVAEAGTEDVGVLIAVGDWLAIDRALENNPDASPLKPLFGRIRGTRLGLGGQLIDLEFISGEPFAGPRGADEFFEYVLTYRSEKVGQVRYASPAVVWYMRLSMDDAWEQYVSKIRREIVAGVPESTFDTVAAIAARFGSGDKIRERIAFARKLLQLFESRS